jgi:anti-anti-sigma regulatory factor
MYLSGERLVSAVRLPVCWSVDEVERLGEVVENAGDVDALILDFEGVRGFGAADAGAVMRALATLSDQGRLVYLASVPGAVRRTMRLNRCWDALEDRVCAGPRQVVARLNEVWHRVSCFVALDLGGEILTIRFCGRLEAPELAVLDIKGIAEHLAGRDVVVDLKYCAFVDNAGQAFLLKLRRETLAGGHRFVLRGAAPDVRQAFAVSDLEEVFEWGDP